MFSGPSELFAPYFKEAFWSDEKVPLLPMPNIFPHQRRQRKALSRNSLRSGEREKAQLPFLLLQIKRQRKSENPRC